jgi:quercetin dioxygenase-like cupin family protein
MEYTSWDKIEAEQLKEGITRQMLSGANTTVARIFLERGAIVPRHSHVNEQFTMILSGALKFTFDNRELVVYSGEILYIPPNEPHAAEALEDTVDVDFFCPRREDWINKTDAYLRGGK